MRFILGGLLAGLIVLGHAVSVRAAGVGAGSGVEVTDPGKLEYIVEEVSEDGRRLGITKERIRQKVEKHLRAAGITPLDGETTGTVEPFVYVRVVVGGSGFNIRVEFSRPVLYAVNGQVLQTFGVMWSKSITGYSTDGAYVIGAVDGPIERFIDEFLKANSSFRKHES